MPVQFLSAAMLLACGLAIGAEDTDFGVPPTRQLRLADYSAPTPREVPGARTVQTADLRAWLQGEVPARPVLFDVVGDEKHDSIPGAVWLPGAGRGSSFSDALQGQLANVLELLGGRPGVRAGIFAGVLVPGGHRSLAGRWWRTKPNDQDLAAKYLKLNLSVYYKPLN